MSHLLHIDSSIRVEGSVTRALSARAAEVWRAAADVTPAMSELIPLARKSRADADHAVDNLWSPAAMAA